MAVADVDEVADREGIIDQHGDAGHDVFEDRLRAEAGDDGEDAGSRQQRPDVDAELVEHDEA